MSIPAAQKAWVAVRKGAPEQGLEFKADWPVQKKLSSGEVLVKVKAGALNPVGYKMLKLAPDWWMKRPHVVESDLAGTIVDSGDSNFTNGDEVFGWVALLNRSPRQGALCEYAVTRATDIVLRPPNITPIQASGVCLVALTAIQALDEAKLEAGQTILINGASTSVGLYAAQIAKIIGAKVVGVASGRNEKLVREHGVDEFIDYTKVGPLHVHLSQNPPTVKYNVILEAVGIFDPSLYTHSKPYLAPNGIFVSVGPQPKFDLKSLWDGLRLASVILPSFMTGVKASYHITTLGDNQAKNQTNLSRMKAWLAEGKIKPPVDSVYAFEDALKAYERILTSRAAGKVVVKIDNSAT